MTRRHERGIWLIGCAVAVALGVLGARWGDEVAPPHPARAGSTVRADERSAPAEVVGDDLGQGRCDAELEAAAHVEGELRQCQEQLAVQVRERAVTPRAPAPSAHPEPVVPSPARADVEAEAVRRRERLAATLRLVAEETELSEVQVQGVVDHVCAIKELRLDAIDGVASGDLTAEAANSRVEEERARVLEQLQATVGEEAYGRLRKLGGIGMVNETVDCAAPE